VRAAHLVEFFLHALIGSIGIVFVSTIALLHEQTHQWS
jgi:hypothetical protein